MTAKKRRTHKLADQHPLGAAFAALAVCFVVFIVLAMVFDAIWTYALGLPANAGYPNVPAALLVLLIYWLWYRPEFEGALRGGKPGIGFKFSVFIVISWAILPLQFAFTSAKMGMPTFITVGNSPAVGGPQKRVNSI